MFIAFILLVWALYIYLEIIITWTIHFFEGGIYSEEKVLLYLLTQLTIVKGFTIMEWAYIM